MNCTWKPSWSNQKTIYLVQGRKPCEPSRCSWTTVCICTDYWLRFWGWWKRVWSYWRASSCPVSLVPQLFLTITLICLQEGDLHLSPTRVQFLFKVLFLNWRLLMDYKSVWLAFKSSCCLPSHLVSVNAIIILILWISKQNSLACPTETPGHGNLSILEHVCVRGE